MNRCITYSLLFLLLLFQIGLYCQEFECTGAFYLIIYTEGENKTILYEITENDEQFEFNEISLSKNVHLSGLSYNTTDLHLWALDVTNFELVRINKNGIIESMGKVEAIDENLSYRSGMMSPDGKSYYFLAYNQDNDSALKFYEIDLQADVFVSEFDDISNASLSRIQDMAVDPIFGAVYGYNNLDGTIVQFGIDGQIATIGQTTRELQSIDALFFNRDAELYGYTPQGQLYAVDKIEGNLQFIQQGPQGTSADGCACPYTSEFFKSIAPQKLIPCEPFDVRYTFRNHLGISHTNIRMRDTFPDGFEIVNIASSIPYTLGDNNGMDHVLALNNMIYLNGGNVIIVTVQPTDTFFGPFSSRARQGNFPKAVTSVQYSDDPSTEDIIDPTFAEIISASDLNLMDSITFSCDGLVATIHSPVDIDEILWSTGENSSAIDVTEVGWYGLEIETDCFRYVDSVFIDEFLMEKSVDLGEDQTILIGDTIILTLQLNRDSEVRKVTWSLNGNPIINCENCTSQKFAPAVSSTIQVTVEDVEGCITSDEVFIEVEFEKFTYASNAFSPNGDSINDRFTIFSSLPGNYTLNVYDRWGNLISEEIDLELNNIDHGWDGKYKGEFVQNGTFVWVANIKYITGDTEQLFGNILLSK